ncbi:MAG: pitrilysin family protein [Methylococcaceae bacterium]|jgi:zinc protease
MKKRLMVAALLYLPVLTALAETKVSERLLANGLKVLVKEDHRSPVVVSQVWYKVGSSYEPGGITGISHMLEHMMFKGTDKHPVGEFSKIIAENGGDENAFTGRDYTAYFQTMNKSRLEVSFELEADRMRHLHLLPDELKKELQVVTEERRMRTDDKPRAKMEEYFMAMAYSNSPYKNPVIGWPADIASYTVEDLQAWYQRWYAPNNATLVVVGDVEPEAVFSLAEKYFAELKTSTIEPLKPQTEVEQVGSRQMTVKLPAKLPYIIMGYKVPTLKTAADESEAYALEVLSGVLDGGSSARLSSQLVRGKQIAISASAAYDLSSRLPEMFVLEGTPAEGKSVLALQKALTDQVAQLQSQLISPDELARIKAQVLASAVYERDSMFYQALQLGMMETVGLGWKKVDEYVDKVNQVTAEQVRAVARKYLIEDHLNIAYLEPQALTGHSTPDNNGVAGSSIQGDLHHAR